MRDYSIEKKYPGERPGKTVGRLFTTASCIAATGLDAFRRGWHMVLLGNAGDVRLLDQLGVPPSQIVAVDKDARVCKRWQSTYPEMHIIHSDVGKVSEQLAEENFKFTTINLDFTGNLSPSLLKTCHRVIDSSLTPKTVLSVTFQAARELPWNLPIKEALFKAKMTVDNLKREELKEDLKLPRPVALMHLLREDSNKIFQGLRYFSYNAAGRSLRGNPAISCMGVLMVGGGDIQCPWPKSQQFIPSDHLDVVEAHRILRKAGLPDDQLEALNGHKKGGGNAIMRSHCEPHPKADGAMLRKRREALSLSRTQLAEGTKISSKGIENLECCRNVSREKVIWADLMAALEAAERKAGKAAEPKPLAKTTTNGNGHSNGISKLSGVRVAVATVAVQIAQTGNLSKQEKELILRAVG